MNSLWPSRSAGEAPPAADTVAIDVADTGTTDIAPDGPQRPTPKPPARPPLLRGAVSQPPPGNAPPPAQPAPNPSNGGAQQQPAQDSLSLAQLRRIVADFPKQDPVAYDFEYIDLGTLDEEIDEWFVYQPSQWARLKRVEQDFEKRWEQELGKDATWEDVDVQARNKLVEENLRTIASGEPADSSAAIGFILYIVLGRWKAFDPPATALMSRGVKSTTVATESQLELMRAGVELIARLGGAKSVWAALIEGLDTLGCVQICV
jgi:hypothetical protein